MDGGQGSFAEAFASPRLGRNARLEQVSGLFDWSGFEEAHRDFLPFAAGEIDTILETSPESLAVAGGQLRYDRVREGVRSSPADPLVIVSRRDATHSDVVARREVEAHEILEDHPDPGAELVEVVVTQVPPIE